MLLYWTGMRIGELLALTYEDIDLEKRIISISKSYQRLNGKDVITPPKTPKSNRKITIPPFLAEELKEYCSHLYGIMPNERMFRFTKSYMEHEIVRSCIYNRICVVGKKEVIYKLVEKLQNMQTNISVLVKQLEQKEVTLTADGLADMRNDCMDILQAIIAMLDGAKYLWQEVQVDKEKSPDSGNC